MTRTRRRSAPYSGASSSSRITPWATLCTVLSLLSVVRSSSSSTVAPCRAK